MKHVMQHPGLPFCGHACLAMILDISIEDAITKMGHTRLTKTSELVASLGKRARDKRLIPVRQRKVPDFAIMKVTWEGRPRRSHFVIHRYDDVHDPLMSCRMSKYNWDRWLEGRGRVTSALKLR